MANDAAPNRPQGKRRENAAIAEGTRIGNYIVERRLGAGGQGEVFLARDVVLQRLVAIKVFLSRDGDFKSLDEARLIAKLDHPNIVRIYHVERWEGCWYTAMEYVDGGSLESRISRVGTLKIPIVLKYAIGAADALEHAHRIGVMHRDIKPQNILLSRADVPKIADFGLAALMSEDSPKGPAGRWYGTPSFMAPEIWSGEPATPQADIYSMGATMFYMLVGRTPFEGNNLDALRLAHASKEVPFPKDIAAPVAKLIARCMAKRAIDRPSSARELCEELEALALQVERNRNSGNFTASVPEDATEEVHAQPLLSEAKVRAAELATLELPGSVRARTELDHSLQGKAPVVVLYGSQTDLRDHLLQAVLDRSGARGYHLAALVVIRHQQTELFTSIAQRFGIDPASSSRIESLIRELAPESSTVPGLLQVNLLRQLTEREIGVLGELAARTSGAAVKIVIVADEKIGAHLVSESAAAGLGNLVVGIRVHSRSRSEGRQFIERWTERATEGVRWTHDAVRLALHFESIGKSSLDKIVRNALALAVASEKCFVTTWCVLGSVAHRGLIHSAESIEAPWRSQPAAWPSSEVLTLLEQFRAESSLDAVDEPTLKMRGPVV